MPTPEPRRSPHRYVSLQYALVDDLCRYPPYSHDRCQTPRCECSCHRR